MDEGKVSMPPLAEMVQLTLAYEAEVARLKALRFESLTMEAVTPGAMLQVLWVFVDADGTTVRLTPGETLGEALERHDHDKRKE